jgi:signal peptidase I
MDIQSFPSLIQPIARWYSLSRRAVPLRSSRPSHYSERSELTDPEQTEWRAQPAKHNSLAWFGDVLAVIVAIVLILLIYPPVRVEGTSMVPMLQDQDRLFINKAAYFVGDIHRRDVVVFRYPRDITKSYIKRVIALPGDRIRIDHGRVYVNDTLLSEPYVPARYADERSQPEITVPPGDYFMMGDHRSISSDSRDFGPVDRQLIYGKASFVYWPFDQAGVVH